MIQQSLENINNIIEQSTAQIQEFITWVSINKNALYIIILVTAISIILLIIGYIIKSLKRKWNIFFYICIFTLMVLGGFWAFLFPIAINSGFNKDDDGPVLRQLLIYVTGGILAAITLGETHRKNTQEKQKNNRDHERQVHAERRSRYTQAVAQLASIQAPIRMGGVYTLVGLADEWLADESLNGAERYKEGQIIINNLCAYIRSPFPLSEQYDKLKLTYKEYKKNQDTKKPIYPRKKFMKYQALFREEREVRIAILEEITNRLGEITTMIFKKGTKIKPGDWSCFDYDFRNSIFFYDVICKDIIFLFSCSFSGSMFLEKAFFANTEFNYKSDFAETNFKHDADFSGANFKHDADFSGAKFKQDTSFSKATFEKSTDFSGAKFKGFSYFSGAKFKQDTSFSKATFEKSTNFSGAKFKGLFSYFSGAKFKQDTYFSGATFEGFTDFSKTTTFKKLASFPGTTFKHNANFSGVKFKGLADFSGTTTFKQYTNFSDTTFEKGINLSEAIIEQEIHFTRANFSYKVDPKSYNFNFAPNSPFKITTKEEMHDGRNFIIPKDAELFDPHKSSEPENDDES